MAVPSARNLPIRRLPSEILFRIVDFVSIDRVLSLRSICRSFRNHINTHVMHAYLQRTKFVANLEVPPRVPTHKNRAENQPLNVIQASFSHVETATDAHAQLDNPNTPKRAGSHAGFDLDTRWLDAFATLTQKVDINRISCDLFTQLRRQKGLPRNGRFRLVCPAGRRSSRSTFRDPPSGTSIELQPFDRQNQSRVEGHAEYISSHGGGNKPEGVRIQSPLHVEPAGRLHPNCPTGAIHATLPLIPSL